MNPFTIPGGRFTRRQECETDNVHPSHNSIEHFMLDGDQNRKKLYITVEGPSLSRTSTDLTFQLHFQSVVPFTSTYPSVQSLLKDISGVIPFFHIESSKHAGRRGPAKTPQHPSVTSVCTRMTPPLLARPAARYCSSATRTQSKHTRALAVGMKKRH